jgi:excisionase family DNA binding protein
VANNDRPMSSQEAAEYLGIAVDTVRRLARSGRLRSYRMPGRGRKYFFHREDLWAMLEEREVGAGDDVAEEEVVCDQHM